MLSPRADERAAVVFEDLASALDAGLPLVALGGEPDAGDQVLSHLAIRRGVKLGETERRALDAGWRSGRGAAALRGRAEQRQRRAEFRRQVLQGLRYPLLLAVMLLFASLATMALIGPWIAITLALVYVLTALLVWRFFARLRRGDARLERLPVIGGLLSDVREVPYLETLHALYAAGVPIVEAHRTAVAAVQMQDLRQRLQIAQGMLEKGEPLRESLHNSASLDLETRTLLATGEQAGQLEDALHRALRRRQDVAARKLSAAARRLGQVAYALAVVGVVVIVFRFYSAYFTLWRR
ncbi:MAG: type II secretion system F family protein [Planctomycetes bacterium]|nr:type II secretion system F family protein [Planctomycetota bacterium]